MRCPYCGQLIIHKFSGRYNRMDRKRKARHMRLCDERPDRSETGKVDSSNSKIRIERTETEYDPEICPQCGDETNKFVRECESCGADKWSSGTGDEQEP